MSNLPLPANESNRQASLEALSILDTPAEERFDRITRLAKRLFGVPMAAISLIDEDRQWFKSRAGLPMSQTPREHAFCGHAILGADIMEVHDASLDCRFQGNPLVVGELGVRFYAGCPLSGPDGSKLGTLCLFDSRPRNLTGEDRALLSDLASMVEQELVTLRLATTDELTGLSNRRGFLGMARKLLAVCQRAGRPAALSFFDLDGLKAVNDRFGHAAGDELIRGFARALSGSFRDSDLIARLGGDEFVALFALSRDGEELAEKRLRTAIEACNQTLPGGREIKFSVGTVHTDPSESADIEHWLSVADSLMYQRKNERRSRELRKSSGPRDGAAPWGVAAPA